MKLFFDWILGKMVVDQVEAHGVDTDTIATLGSRMDEAEDAISDLGSRMDEAEDAIEELTPENNHLLYQQFAFYHSGDKRITLGDVDAGEWQEDGFFPVDWRFDEWGHDGLILHFGNWA